MLKLHLSAALRSAKSRPIAFFVIVTTLGICIACVSLTFVLLDSVFFAKRGVPDEDRVAVVMAAGSGVSSYPNYRSYQESTQSFSGLVASWTDSELVLQQEEVFTYLTCEFVSPNYFDVLQPGLLLGSGFSESGGDNSINGDVVVISESLWRRQFGEDRQILGRQITLNSIAFTVVGIVEDRFQGMDAYARSDLWIPVSSIRISQHAYFVQSRGFSAFRIFGRLKDGVSFPQANLEMETVSRNVDNEFPEYSSGRKDLVEVLSVGDYAKIQNRSLYRLYVLLLIIASFLLAIATANVMNVFLSGIVERRGELAMKVCLGATRLELFYQFLVEGLMTTFAGTFIGGGLCLVARLVLVNLAGFSEIEISYRAVGVLAVLVILLMGCISVIPYLYVGRMNLNVAAQEVKTGFFKNKTQKGLLLVQILITTILMVTFLFFGKSLREIQSEDFGFQDTNMVLLNVNVKSKRWRIEPAWPYFHNLKAELESIPGVNAVGVSTNLPLSAWSSTTVTYDPSEKETEDYRVRRAKIGPDYFKAMNVPLLMGRFTDYNDHYATEYAKDSPGPLPVIVNQALARRFFPDEDPIDKVLYKGSERRSVQIVGMVKDFTVTPGEKTPPMMFFPYYRYAILTDFFIFHISSSLPSDVLLPIVKERTEAFNRFVPIGYISTVEDRVADVFSEVRNGSVVIGFYALMGLLLCSLGTWSLYSFELNSRKTEISIRMALGATPLRIFLMISSAIGLQMMAGYLVGVGIFIGAWNRFSPYFYKVELASPELFSIALLILAAVAGVSIAGSMARVFSWKIADILR